MKLKHKLLTLILLTTFTGVEVYAQRNPDRNRDRDGRRGEVAPPSRGVPDRGMPDRGGQDRYPDRGQPDYGRGRQGGGRYGRGRMHRPQRPNRGERQTAFMARQLVSSTQELVDQVQWEAYQHQHRVLRVAQNLEYQATQLARTVAMYDDQSPMVRRTMNQFVMELNHAQEVFRQGRLSWHVDQAVREVKQDARQLRQAIMMNDRGYGRGDYRRDGRYDDRYYEEDQRHEGGKKAKLKKIGKAALIGAAIIGIIDIID